MRKKVRIEGGRNKSNRKMGAEQQRGSVQGGGNKSNRKMGAEQQRGSMLTIPQPKRKAVWRLRAQTEYALESCRVAQCERTQPSLEAAARY